MRKIYILGIIIMLTISSCTLFGGGKEELQTPEAIYQWAESATASSAYGGIYGGGRNDQSAFSATGEPDVVWDDSQEECMDSQNAWTIDAEDDGLHTLELKYYDPVYVSKVRIKETLGQGSVVKIELKDGEDYFTMWEGTYSSRECPYILEKSYSEPVGNYSNMGMTPFSTNTVKPTIDTDVPGWNEIDAVELIGYDTKWYIYNDTIWYP